MQQIISDESNIGDLSDLSTDQLKNVAETAENIKQKEDEVFQLEEKLKQAKKDLLKMTDEDLPMLMEEINLESFTLSDGSKVNISPTYGVQSRLTIDLKRINGLEIMVLEIL